MSCSKKRSPLTFFLFIYPSLRITTFKVLDDLPTAPSLPSSCRQEGQMGVHSGRPQGVCDTQLGIKVGPSGNLNAASALPRVWKEWGELSISPTAYNNSPQLEITLSQELAISLLSGKPCNGCCCVLSPPMATIPLTGGCGCWGHRCHAADIIRR